MLKAVTRQASLVDHKISLINTVNAAEGKSKISTAYFFDHYAEKEDVAVMVSEEDFVSAERELVPSVSLKELEHYGMVRAQFEKVVPDPSTNSNPNQVEMNGKGKGKVVEQRQIEERPRSNGKGKARVSDKKGKGKMVGGWDDGYEDEGEDEEGVFGGSNGHTKGKGKGKGKMVDMGFQEGSVDDDEGLY